MNISSSVFAVDHLLAESRKINKDFAQRYPKCFVDAPELIMESDISKADIIADETAIDGELIVESFSLEQQTDDEFLYTDEDFQVYCLRKKYQNLEENRNWEARVDNLWGSETKITGTKLADQSDENLFLEALTSLTNDHAEAANAAILRLEQRHEVTDMNSFLSAYLCLVGGSSRKKIRVLTDRWKKNAKPKKNCATEVALISALETLDVIDQAVIYQRQGLKNRQDALIKAAAQSEYRIQQLKSRLNL